MGNVIVLKNHFEGRDTIVYKNHIMNGGCFFHKEDLDVTCKEFNMGHNKKQQIIDALDGHGDYHDSKFLAWFALEYCVTVNVDSEMKQVILKSKDSYCAYLYCHLISDDDDMKQVIMDYGNNNHKHYYLINVKEDEDVRNSLV